MRQLRKSFETPLQDDEEEDALNFLSDESKKYSSVILPGAKQSILGSFLQSNFSGIRVNAEEFGAGAAGHSVPNEAVPGFVRVPGDDSTHHVGVGLVKVECVGIRWKEGENACIFFDDHFFLGRIVDRFLSKLFARVQLGKQSIFSILLNSLTRSVLLYFSRSNVC